MSLACNSCKQEKFVGAVGVGRRSSPSASEPCVGRPAKNAEDLQYCVLYSTVQVLYKRNTCTTFIVGIPTVLGL